MCGKKWPELGKYCSGCGADAVGKPRPVASGGAPEADPGTENPASTSGVTSGVTDKDDEPGTKKLTIHHYCDDSASQSDTLINSADEAGGAEASQSATADTPSDETTVDQTGETVAKTGPSETDLPSTPDAGAGANSSPSEGSAENTPRPLSPSSVTNDHRVDRSQAQDVQGTVNTVSVPAQTEPSVNGNSERYQNSTGRRDSLKRLFGLDRQGFPIILAILIIVLIVILVIYVLNPFASQTQQPTTVPNTTAVTSTTTVSATVPASPTAAPECSPSPSLTETPQSAT